MRAFLRTIADMHRAGLLPLVCQPPGLQPLGRRSGLTPGAGGVEYFELDGLERDPHHRDQPIRGAPPGGRCYPDEAEVPLPSRHLGLESRAMEAGGMGSDLSTHRSLSFRRGWAGGGGGGGGHMLRCWCQPPSARIVFSTKVEYMGHARPVEQAFSGSLWSTNPPAKRRHGDVHTSRPHPPPPRPHTHTHPRTPTTTTTTKPPLRLLQMRRNVSGSPLRGAGV